ncbi:MAG: Mfa1 family fimbria major subunit [Tannerellaceae bacterium]|nr:Mfa1 family fimbria major subunit [Tannerellaceae bacterium]
MNMFKSAIVAATLLLSGCLSEEVELNPGNRNDAAGQGTYATFNVALSDPITKTDLVNDDGETDQISSIRILIYQDYNTLNSVCESDVVVMASDRKSATFQATSGWKRILVIANDYNKPWRLPNQTGKTLADLTTTKTTVSGGRIAAGEIDCGAPAITTAIDTLKGLDFSSISNPKNMIFSNSLADSSCRRQLKGSVPSEESIAGIKGEADNNFTIYVKRVVAKVTASFQGGAYPIETADGKGSLSSVYWGVRNINRAVSIFQVPHTSGKPLAPFFYELTGWSKTALSDQNSYKRYWWTNDYGNDINFPLATGGNSSLRSYYIPENANYIAQPGNTTYIAVKGTFTPAANSVVTGFTHNAATKFITAVKKGSIDPGTTFYRLSGIAGTDGSEKIALYGDGHIASGDFFADAEEALKVAYIAEHHGSIIGYSNDYTPKNIKIDKYNNGICYYRVDIHNGDNYWVERNKAYRGNINGFTSIGDPDMYDIESVPMSTYITASIIVIPWEEVVFSNTI